MSNKFKVAQIVINRDPLSSYKDHGGWVSDAEYYKTAGWLYTIHIPLGVGDGFVSMCVRENNLEAAVDGIDEKWKQMFSLK